MSRHWIVRALSYVLLVGLAVATWAPTRAQQRTGKNPAELLAPYLDPQTMVVARLDPNKVQLTAALDFARPLFEQIGAPVGDLEKAFTHVQEMQAKWREVGGGEVYLVAGLTDAPRSPAFVLTRKGQGADEQRMIAVMNGGPFEVTRSLGEFVFAGSQLTFERLKQQTPVDHADLKAAFDAFPDSALQVAAHLPADVRRVVRELGPPLPAGLGADSVEDLSNAFRWAVVAVDLAPQVSARLAIEASSPAAAEKLKAVFSQGLQLAGKDPQVKRVVPQMEKLATQLAPQIKGSRLVWQISGDSGNQLRELLSGPLAEARRAAARNISISNLKQIALAFHNYHDLYNKFPPAANRNSEGKALLSWRVHLLPYLDQDQLYRKFKLDEPWDSPNNKPLVAQIPRIFVVPGTEELAKSGKTLYVVPVGPKSVFEGPEGMPIRKITDGTSNTILALEVPKEKAVLWTQPDDWQFDPRQPLAGLPGEGFDGLLAAFCDGSVRLLPKAINANTFRKLLQATDGEPVEPF